MDKGKYSFEDLNRRDVLPLDTNARAEEYARTLQDPGLMAMMRMFREKKITDGYGEATHLSGTGTPDVIFSFQNGICKHASPLVWIDGKNVAKGSIKFF